ncbi:hypothetical protein FA15DRAFT_604893, partial [Coprinopsis marcescibilis]
LPSWINPAPRNWGTTERGKLSADNWRTLCTIHLPVTLIRLWHSGTEQVKNLLRNFMDLASAVRLAHMKTTSPKQIAMYDAYMKQYLQGIMELFPDQPLRPSHHMAMHISDCMERFGPTHAQNGGWFERYILFFHSLNTNLHRGALCPELAKFVAKF